MKKKALLFTLAAAAVILTLSSYSSGPAANGLGNRTASGCGGSGCHANSNNNYTVVVVELVDKVTGQEVTNFKYIPGRGYTLYLRGSNTDLFTKFGFQLTSVQKLSTSTQAGTFSNWPGSGQVHVQTVGGISIVEHATTLTGQLETIGGTSYAIDTVKMDWTAPATSVGTIRFNYVMNCVNGNGVQDNGDEWNTSVTDLDPDNTGVEDVNNSVVSLFPNPAQETLNLTFRAEGTYRATVCDATGRVVYAGALSPSGPGRVAAIPVTSLVPGNYFLVMQGKTGRQSMPFVKQ